MRKLPLISLVFAVVILIAANVNAQTYQLGAGVAVKVDYFHFTGTTIDNLNAQDGVYIGLEAYKQVFIPHFFLGMELGWAGTSGTISTDLPGNPFSFSNTHTLSTDINYIPIEFNAKYVLPISPVWDLGFGAGFSRNYFGIEGTVPGTGSVSDNDWIWGGQFFGELNYKVQNWAFGLNVKYQLTEDMHLFSADTGTSADNLRIGGQVAIGF